MKEATTSNSAGADGLRQAMLKMALKTIPQLTEENYSIWKDKMTVLLKLRGVLNTLNNLTTFLGDANNAELTMLFLAKMDSMTHNNVITANNSESAQRIWLAIKERFASSQASNHALILNHFLHLPNSLQTLKVQIMHSDKELNVDDQSDQRRLGEKLHIAGKLPLFPGHNDQSNQRQGIGFKRISKEGRLVLKGKVNNGLFSVKHPDSVGATAKHTSNTTNHHEALRDIIHKKFGHASIQRLKPLLPNSVSKCKRDNFECKSCVLSKITKQPFNRKSTTARRPFERLHLDLIGPINPESSRKHRFILTVVNSHLGYLAGFPLAKKEDTTEVLINLLKSENHQKSYFPRLICSDGGGEFIRKRMPGPESDSKKRRRKVSLGNNPRKVIPNQIVTTCRHSGCCPEHVKCKGEKI
ncbi:hypothetical protein VP01_1560g7 [Puccinia sorghi]|uniref:Integrase catalytic domain-containing protein n=1 Tax=Puccinia sorghi TaxID=27349 RepID=A0A0L6VI66_9BASI|nr:hypothetical protein VP01_1560g7 [Puccinia sorghi]